jgi:hypothetical protein
LRFKVLDMDERYSAYTNKRIITHTRDVTIVKGSVKTLVKRIAYCVMV